MLEIIAIAMITGRLKNTATSKGRSGWWAALGPLLWIGGEVLGAAGAAIAGMDGFAHYAGALVGAVIGVGIAYFIVNLLSPNELWDNDAPIVNDGFSGGNYEPNNPYNAPRG